MQWYSITVFPSTMAVMGGIDRTLNGSIKCAVCDFARNVKFMEMQKYPRNHYEDRIARRVGKEITELTLLPYNFAEVPYNGTILSTMYESNSEFNITPEIFRHIIEYMSVDQCCLYKFYRTCKYYAHVFCYALSGMMNNYINRINSDKKILVNQLFDRWLLHLDYGYTYKTIGPIISDIAMRCNGSIKPGWVWKRGLSRTVSIIDKAKGIVGLCRVYQCNACNTECYCGNHCDVCIDSGRSSQPYPAKCCGKPVWDECIISQTDYFAHDDAVGRCQRKTCTIQRSREIFPVEEFDSKPMCANCSRLGIRNCYYGCYICKSCGELCCDNCYVICDYCSMTHDEVEDNETDDTNKSIPGECVSCFEKHNSDRKCPECGKILQYQEIEYVWWMSKNNCEYCGGDWGKGINECHICNKLFDNDCVRLCYKCGKFQCCFCCGKYDIARRCVACGSTYGDIRRDRYFDGPDNKPLHYPPSYYTNPDDMNHNYYKINDPRDDLSADPYAHVDEDAFLTGVRKRIQSFLNKKS